MKNTIDNYHIIEHLYESSHSRVYRALHLPDQSPVILKVLQRSPLSQEERSRFTCEYEITRELHAEGIVRPLRLEEEHMSLRMVEEDIGAESLDKWMKRRRMTLEECLFLGIRIAESLKSIHEAGIIHKSISPSNIVWNRQTGQVQIIDFGMATHLPSEPSSAQPFRAETLPYISPEQTGRMNRLLDYRTDFYSLGITLYEMLTGRLPFDSSDALEVVHGHIAKPVPPPHLINTDVPCVVSEIVIKLLAKTAEERYQSTAGLKHDLNRCLENFCRTGTVEPFRLGEKDFSHQLQIPKKLYGREQELEVLRSAFNRVSAGCAELVLVTGHSGIGKSALIHEMQKPITEKGGYFITGKFDQRTRDIPYAAITMAFRSLVQQLLAEPEEQLRQWEAILSAALEGNGQVIIDIVPELENLIGVQPELMPLGSEEKKNRFKMVFQKFIQVFTQKEHPLIMFLDDLQWVDSASLNLLKEMIIDGRNQYLLVIGAFRDNEVPLEHPLSRTIDEIRKEGAAFSQFTLSPLDKSEINRLLADTFDAEISFIESLSQLLLEKTGGNPFFINQFLQDLNELKLIRFHAEQLAWTWAIDEIRAQDITDNMAEMIINRLRSLPEALQRVLQLAACVGNQFNLRVLSIISEHRPTEVLHDLMEVMKLGFILPLDEQYKLVSEKESQADYHSEFRFTHDRVQQAAYALIARGHRKEVHVKIGRLLLRTLSKKEIADHVFHIVRHLNDGTELLADDEKKQLAELNLVAGKRAKDSIAYLQALIHFKTGISLLPENCWESDYPLSFELYKECCECQFILTHFDKAESLFENMINHVDNPTDKAAIFSIIIRQNSIQGNYDVAIEMGKNMLREFGVELPDEQRLEAAAQQEIAEVKQRLGSRQAKDLIDQPLLNDATTKALVKILIILEAPTYFQNFPLFKYLVAKATSLGLTEGNSPELPHAYSNFGLILCLMGDFQQGYEFGSLALLLSEKLNRSRCMVYNTMGLCINHWTKHVRSSADIARKGIQYGLEEGEIQFACYNHFGLLNALVSQGLALDGVLKEADRSIHFVRKNKNTMSEYCFTSIRQFALNLQGKTMDKYSFDEHDYNESGFIEKSKELMMSMAYFYVYKLQSYYLFEDYENAYDMSVHAQKEIHQVDTFLTIVSYNFFSSLTLTARLTKDSPKERKKDWKTLKANQRQMELWSHHCPENFLHMFLLLEAEIAKIEGRNWQASDLYDQSIASAHEQGFVQNEAIGNELCAKFWMEKGKADFSKLYMEQAYNCYGQWGAQRKVQDLEEKYPQLLTNSITKKEVPGRQTSLPDSAPTAPQLDMSTVIKASQAISGEIELTPLHIRMLTMMIENAGAQKGSLLFEQDGELRVAAVVESEQGTSPRAQTNPAELSAAVCPAIVNYVKRTSKVLVLDNASSDERFRTDPYIIKNQPKSILCTPILKQSQSIGIVYLENNLITGAFTTDRLQVLSFLASQAAISLENARLFEERQRHAEELAEEIAERKQAEAALRENELLFQSIADYTYDWESWISPEGKLLWINSAVEKFTGYSIDECKAMTDYPLPIIDAADRARMADEFKEALQKSSGNDVEFRIVKKDGTEAWMAASWQPIYSREKQWLGYRSSVRQITDRKKAEEALRESEATIKNKLKAITEPEGDIGSLELSDIIDVEVLQSIMEDFYNLTGMLGAVLDVSGKVLVAVGWQDICTKFHRCNPDSCKNCIESDTILTQGVPEGTVKAYHCKNNMWDTVTPIIVGGRHVGNVFMGQYLLEGEVPDYDLFRKQAKKYGFDEKEYLAALDRVPRFSRETVNAGMRFYSKLAKIISTLSFSAIQQSRMLSERKQTELELINAKERAEESEKKYRDLINLAQEGIWVIDKDNVTNFANLSMAKMLGYSPEEMIGKTLFDFMDEAGIKLANENLARRKAGLTEQHDFEFICKNGNRIFCTIATAAILDESGDYQGAIAGVIDITERKEAEDELEKARNYISNIIDSMPSVLIGVDSDCIVTQWNKEAERVSSISATEATGKLISEVFPRLAGEMEHLYQAIRTRKICSDPTSLREEAGHTSYEDITIFPLITNGVQGAVIRIDDVTVRQELEAQLNQARKMDAVGQLAGGIAHDFNNMLGVIISASELLKSPSVGLNQKGSSYVEMILSSATRAADLISKLLAFSRKSEHRHQLVDIDGILDDALTILTNTIDKRVSISIEKNAKKTTVSGDHAALQSIIINLGINASHAMPDGGELQISTDNIFLDSFYCAASPFEIKPGEYVDITVKDTGSGIPPENLRKVFEPFFTTKEQGQGTGLGLAAAYGTVQDHHGAITLYSELGTGTVFHIYLPCIQSPAERKETEAEIVTGTGTILVVDDENNIRQVLREMLRGLGYQVLTATNGQEGVAVFEEHHNEIDLVIMDMIMPVMNGQKAFYEMRCIDPNCKVLLASGFSKEEQLADLLEAGLAGFIQKPYRSSEMSQVLARLMQPE